MKPSQPPPPPALPSAALAEVVLTWPLRSRWPSRAGRPRSPEAREAPGPLCAGRLPLSVLEESVLGLSAQAWGHPSVHHSSFQKSPRRPGELTRSVGIRDGTDLPRDVRSRVRERSARGQLRPRVTCRLRAAAAAPAQAAALPAPHCRPRAWGSLRALALSVHVLSPSISPFTSFPAAFFFPSPSFIVVSFSTSRRQALQVGGLPSSLTLPLPGGGGRGYCWPLLLPFLPHAGPPPPPRAASWCNAQAAWVRPKPASLLSMPNCPAGVALDSRVLAPLRRLRLAWGGEGGGVGGESAQLWRSPAFSPGGLPGDGRLTHPARPHTVS